jgi:phosphonate transport system substrate-binding protein
VRTGHDVQGIFLVRRDSAVHSLADLKGKTIMMAQPLSIVYQMAKEQLRRQGLVGGQNITIADTRTHNNALNAPMRGEADASVTGALLWQGADAETRAAMRQIDVTEKAPGFILMAHQRLSAPQFKTVKAALMEFQRTPAGKEFFKATGFEAFLAIDDRTMKRMDPYTRILPAQPR